MKFQEINTGKVKSHVIQTKKQHILIWLDVNWNMRQLVIRRGTSDPMRNHDFLILTFKKSIVRLTINSTSRNRPGKKEEYNHKGNELHSDQYDFDDDAQEDFRGVT